MHLPLFTAPERLSAAWSSALVGLVDWGLPLWIAALLIAIVVDRVWSARRVRSVVTRRREQEGGPYRGGSVEERLQISVELPWRARFWRRTAANLLFVILGVLAWIAFAASPDFSDYRTLRALGHTVVAPVIHVDEWMPNCDVHYAVTVELPDHTIVRDFSSKLGAHYAKLEKRVPWTLGPDGLSRIGRVEDVGIHVLPGALIPFLFAGLLLAHARLWRKSSR